MSDFSGGGLILERKQAEVGEVESGGQYSH